MDVVALVLVRASMRLFLAVSAKMGRNFFVESYYSLTAVIVGKSVAMETRSSVSMRERNYKVSQKEVRNCSSVLVLDVQSMMNAQNKDLFLAAAQMVHYYSLLAAD